MFHTGGGYPAGEGSIYGELPIGPPIGACAPSISTGSLLLPEVKVGDVCVAKAAKCAPFSIEGILLCTVSSFLLSVQFPGNTSDGD